MRDYQSLAEWLEAKGNPKHGIADGDNGNKVLAVDSEYGMTLFSFKETTELIKFNIVIWNVDDDGEGEAEIGYLNAVSEYHAAALLRERVRNGRYPNDAWLDYVHNGKKISIDIKGRRI